MNEYIQVQAFNKGSALVYIVTYSSQHVTKEVAEDVQRALHGAGNICTLVPIKA